MESIPLTNGGLSDSEEVGCLSQLPDMKGFGAALALCNSNGLFLPGDLICGAAVPDGLLTTSPAPKSPKVEGRGRKPTRPLLDNRESSGRQVGAGVEAGAPFTAFHVRCCSGELDL